MSSFNVYKGFICFAIWQFIIPETLSCGYRVTNMSEIVTGINIPPLPVGYQPRSATANSLRILFDYTDSFNGYPGAADIKTYIMEPARLGLQSMITVINPISGVLRVDRQCINGLYQSSGTDFGCATGCVTPTTCTAVTVPDKYLNKCKMMSSSGVVSYAGTDGAGEPNVDIVLLVTANNCPSGVLAFANSCFQESQLDRPILGIVNICPGMIVANTNNRVNSMIIKHEIVHALGFGVDKFAFYRNPDGTPIVPRNNIGRPNLGLSADGYYNWNEKIIVQVTRQRTSVSMSYTKPFNALVLPNVVAVAKEHFNCPLITSVELEDFGTLGSALSHFDQYVVYNEYMTAENNGWNQRFSKFTLALLKDTGWYGVDYTKADDLDYGKNAGCVLPLYGCYAYMQAQRALNNPIDPFCDVVNGQILQCSPSRQYYQYCRIVRYNSVDPTVQYFTSVKGSSTLSPSLYAGSSAYSEYCPMKSVPIIDGFNSDCTDTNNIGTLTQFTPIPSSYGPNALCFDTTLSGQSIYGATCLNYTYDGNGVNYGLCLGGQAVTCSNNAVQQFNLASSSSFYSGPGSISCINPSLLKQNNLIQTCPTMMNTTPKEGNNLHSRMWIIISMTFFGIFIQLNGQA